MYDLKVKTLEGKGKLRIPAGTQPGHVLRVKGKGIPRRAVGGRGDQLVEIGIEVPTTFIASIETKFARKRPASARFFARPSSRAGPS